ncbi:MAG: hypothetical protein H8E31_07705, partial [Planctomycetes bacterium]|nr:hypothetical protein [Planctomycetota bacterium]
RVESGRGGALDRAGLAAALHDLALQLDALEADQGTLEPGALCRRIDALLLGPYFELGGRNEEYARVLGPGLYSRIWEGFAVSERLLARAWSMATDGHLEEALLELPRARQQLALAVQRADQE